MSWGVNGENGEIVDMKDYGVWEAYSVKAQTYKTAIEVRHLFQLVITTHNSGKTLFSLSQNCVYSELICKKMA